MKRVLIILLIIIFPFCFTGCSCRTKEDIEIYTTVYALDFITKSIVGDKVKVKSVYPASAEIHEYEPSAKQLIAMSKADIIFYIGQGLEPFIENGLQSTFKNTNCVKITSYSSLNLVNYAGTYAYMGSDTDSADESSFDPHIWLDPDSMEEIANIILINLLSVEKYKEFEEYFRSNYSLLIEKIKALALTYHQTLDVSANKTIIVDHDAYAYWTYRYNIERIGLRGDNESSDPNSKDMIETINIAIEKRIKYILATKYESQEDLIKSSVRQVNDKDSTLGCSVLYLDNLETFVPEGEDYFSVMESNLEILKKALEIEK